MAAPTASVYSSQPDTNIQEHTAEGISNTPHNIESGATNHNGYICDNSRNSATTYFKGYLQAAGSVTLGTTDPILQIPVAGGRKVIARVVGPINTIFAQTTLAAVTAAGTPGTASPASQADEQVLTDS